MSSLRGKTIVITGGSRGIGAAMARRFATEGAKLALLARTESSLESISEEISTKTESLFIPGDISDEKHACMSVEKVAKHFGTIDVLINNAAAFMKKPLEETTLDDFHTIIDVGLRGLFLMTKAVLPFMKRQKHGHIVNMASDVGLAGVPNQSLHCMCKFGVIGFSQSLRHELCRDNIHVSYICPGPTNTWNDPEPSRLLRPEDVADAVLFLVTTHPNAIVSEIIMQPLLRT